jgi:glycerate kinase
MRILVAPNAFKNSLTATDAARSICNGLRQSSASFDCNIFPLGDGGDGTADILIDRFAGINIPAQVDDPLGRKIHSTFGWIEQHKMAIVELAKASGLRLLKPFEYDPLRCNTFGTGELMKAALDKGAEKIILCIGGSATVDGAIGILEAMGIRFLDSAGELISNPANLSELEKIDISKNDPRISQTEWIVLCDVDNFLLGPNGAAAVFGPQKGADPEAVQKLEAALQRLQKRTLEKMGVDMNSVKHGGAAGGVAAGLSVFLQAHLENGIEYFLDQTGFDEILDKSDLLITGEGSIDLQTLQGKAPFGVAKRAKKKNIPVIVLAGRTPRRQEPELDEYFDLLLSINQEPADLATELKNTAVNLEKTAKELGDRLQSVGGNILAITR